MSSSSSIEWTGATWNPVRGCSRVSEGCRNCYAERMAARNLPKLKSPTTGEPFAIMTPSGPRWTGKVELIESALDIPLKRKKPVAYFVNSMSDLFHEALPDEAIDRVFAVMALCPQHTFQVLTKRPERMRKYVTGHQYGRMCDIAQVMARGNPNGARYPLPNVWLGVSVENQETANARIPALLQTPAAVRFVSYEPALGPIEFRDIQRPRENNVDVLRGGIYHPLHGFIKQDMPHLDLIIIGGESGPGARPFDVEWARNTIAQCKAAGVACFVKQMGAPQFIEDSHANSEEKVPDDLAAAMDGLFPPVETRRCSIRGCRNSGPPPAGYTVFVCADCLGALGAPSDGGDTA